MLRIDTSTQSQPITNDFLTYSTAHSRNRRNSTVFIYRLRSTQSVPKSQPAGSTVCSVRSRPTNCGVFCVPIHFVPSHACSELSPCRHRGFFQASGSVDTILSTHPYSWQIFATLLSSLFRDGPTRKNASNTACRHKYSYYSMES